jgi:hypothetical protein
MSAARWLGLVAACALLLAGQLAIQAAIQAAGAQQRDWSIKELGPGIRLHAGKPRIGGQAVEVEFARVEPGSGRIRILTPRSAFAQRGAKVAQLKSAIPEGLAMRDFADLTGAVAVLAGGYVASFSPVQPLGYVRSDSRVSSRSHRSWLVDAMLCANWRDFELGRFEELYRKRDSYADCLQIGPLVVLDGKRTFGGGAELPSGATKLLQARQRQAFVCRDAAGALLIGVSSETALDGFIPFLAKPAAQGGLGCRIAARVTGSTTATLATRGGLFGPDKYLLPTAIAILPGR